MTMERQLTWTDVKKCYYLSKVLLTLPIWCLGGQGPTDGHQQSFGNSDFS
eukprot:m.477750 g.477750  ORF g.477750 m.477750 type:complete len:50 (-) comp44831_c0_seq1:52-201(-)